MSELPPIRLGGGRIGRVPLGCKQLRLHSTKRCAVNGALTLTGGVNEGFNYATQFTGNSSTVELGASGSPSQMFSYSVVYHYTGTGSYFAGTTLSKLQLPSVRGSASTREAGLGRAHRVRCGGAAQIAAIRPYHVTWHLPIRAQGVPSGVAAVPSGRAGMRANSIAPVEQGCTRAAGRCAPTRPSTRTMSSRRWTLTTKISLIAAVFLLLSLMSVGTSLWISWKLEGGAGAVNVAGELRMMTYRLAVSAAQPGRPLVAAEVARMQRAIDVLRAGDAARPLAVPWDSRIRGRFDSVVDNWQRLKPRWLAGSSRSPVARAELDRFVGRINALVRSIEDRLDFWTSLLHTAEMAVGGVVLVAFMTIFFVTYLHVLEPVGRLARGVESIATGDFATRVEVSSTDELGDLARGFNRMAAQLQAVYADLEQRVRDKTAALETEQQRLLALYEISDLVSRAAGLDELSNGFTQAIQRIAHADAALLRWTDDTAERYVLLAAEGLPRSIVDEEHCLMSGSCYCGRGDASAQTQVVHFARGGAQDRAACVRAGFSSLVSVPVRAQQRLLGELNLLYRDAACADPGQHALLDALAGHLAAAMENLHGAALEREAMLSRERGLLARELHDSIAQSLAYMRIQLQLLRAALADADPVRSDKALDDLEQGVRESLADVRELLLHFRTRTHEVGIESALRVTLHKFEAQTGVATQLHIDAHGQPLAADVQIQVLHILQEALSNVRKHARAQRVELTVRSVPQWSFEVRDDGVGFDAQALRDDGADHVGQQIMRERAASIDAALDIESWPGHGTRVRLGLASSRLPRPPALQEAEHG